MRTADVATLDDRSIPTTLADGRVEYRNGRGELHRPGGEPAVVCTDGYRAYYENGRLHRAGDEPAVVWANGAHKYYEHGLLHRSGGKPAVVGANGAHQYYERGKPHRAGGRPAIVDPDGYRAYYEHGQLHRTGDKPAVIGPDGLCEYWEHGTRHRSEGRPAVVWADGSCAYWEHGVLLSRALAPSSSRRALVVHRQVEEEHPMSHSAQGLNQYATHFAMREYTQAHGIKHIRFVSPLPSTGSPPTASAPRNGLARTDSLPPWH